MKLNVLRNIWNHPANRGARTAAIVRALRWEVRRRLVKSATEVPLLGGMKVRCDPSMRGAHVAIVYRGLYDFHDMMFLRRYLRPGDHFLDVGANIGLYALMVSRLVGPSGQIDAFEAVPRIAARLRLHAEINGIRNLIVHEMAASDRDGTVRFKISGDDLIGHIPYSEDRLEDNVIEVKSVRLDDFVGHKTYAAAQLDVEGAEPMVLVGAQKMLARANPPVIFIEINGRLHGYGQTEKGFANWLIEHGYDLATYDADTQRLQEWSESNTDERDNVLAIARNARDAVLARLEESRNKYPLHASTAARQAWP